MQQKEYKIATINRITRMNHNTKLQWVLYKPGISPDTNKLSTAYSNARFLPNNYITY